MNRSYIHAGIDTDYTACIILIGLHVVFTEPLRDIGKQYIFKVYCVHEQMSCFHKEVLRAHVISCVRYHVRMQYFLMHTHGMVSGAYQPL